MIILERITLFLLLSELLKGTSMGILVTEWSTYYIYGVVSLTVILEEISTSLLMTLPFSLSGCQTGASLSIYNSTKADTALLKTLLK